jgi:hypothetical protein
MRMAVRPTLQGQESGPMPRFAYPVGLLCEGVNLNMSTYRRTRQLNYSSHFQDIISKT